MRVIWQTNALRQRTSIASYIRQEFGAKRKRRFLEEVRQLTQKLKHSPGIGQIDPLFADRPQTYRSYSEYNHYTYTDLRVIVVGGTVMISPKLVDQKDAD